MLPFYNKHVSEGEYYGFEPYRLVDVSRRICGSNGNYAGFYVPGPEEIALAKEVIEREQPIRFDVLCRRLSPLFYLEGQRITKTLRSKTERLISRIVPPVVNRYDFVYLKGFSEICVRYRTGDAFHERKTENICHEEMMQALSNIGKKCSYKILKDELIGIAVSALGYSKKGSDICAKLNEALKRMIALGHVHDYGNNYVKFTSCESYRMGDYGTKIVGHSANKGLPFNPFTPAVNPKKKNGGIVCYYSVGDITEADANGCLPILIKKSTFESLVQQKKNFCFKVTNGAKTYLFSKGSRSIYNAVKKAPNFYSVENDTLRGFVLNVKNGELWSMKGEPRLKVCDCGKCETQKNILDSPEVADFLKSRKKELLSQASFVVDNTSISQPNKLDIKQSACSCLILSPHSYTQNKQWGEIEIPLRELRSAKWKKLYCEIRTAKDNNAFRILSSDIYDKLAGKVEPCKSKMHWDVVWVLNINCLTGLIVRDNGVKVARATTVNHNSESPEKKKKLDNKQENPFLSGNNDSLKSIVNAADSISKSRCSTVAKNIYNTPVNIKTKGVFTSFSDIQLN